jgi:hypothetical protein
MKARQEKGRRMTAGKLLTLEILIAVCMTNTGWADSYGLPPFTTSDKVETRIGALEFDMGMPTQETIRRLYDEMDFQRACQAYLWGLPIVSMAGMRAGAEKNPGATDIDVVTYFGYEGIFRYLTGQTTTPYVIALPNLGKTGPLIIDFPAGATAGMINDAWQRPVADLGQAGPDKGKGGTYLVLGPGQKVDDPRADYVIQSTTSQIILLIRLLDPDPEKVAATKAALRLYPYSQRNNPPKTRFLESDAGPGQVMTQQPRGMAYWQRLHKALDGEPVADRDRFFMAMLRPLGIEPGKAFKPDARQTRILTEAALVGEAMARANSFSKRFEGVLYRPDANWDIVIQVTPAQDLDGWSQIDERAAYTYEAATTSKGMVTRTPGVGSTYLAQYYDSEGRVFDGGKNYTLHVPPNPPTGQFWNITLYDADTRSFILTKERRAALSARSEGLQINADGSIDLFFGPEAPVGRESNWIPTAPGRSWFTYFRLYAPLEPYFDRSWPLPDIKRVQ